MGQQVVGPDGVGVGAQLDGGHGHGPDARVVSGHHGGAAHRRVPLEHGLDVVGVHLEPAADDRLVAAADDEQEAVGVDAGQVGRAHPVAVADVVGPDLERPLGVGAEHRARVGVDDPQLAPGVGPPHAAPLRCPVGAVVGDVPPGDAPAELGGAVGDQDGDAVARREGVGVGGIERGGSRHHRPEAGEVGGVGIGLEHHPQGGGHQAGRGRSVPAHGVHPPVDGEPLEQ